jgi:hypothetical protein
MILCSRRVLECAELVFVRDIRIDSMQLEKVDAVAL